MRQLLAVCWVLLLASKAFADCPAVRFQEGAVFVKSPSTLHMTVSLSFEDFTPRRLVCLGNEISRRYPKQSDVRVWIFSSREEAAVFRPLSPYNLPSTSPALHAVFIRDADTHKQYVEVTPLGGVGSPYSTELNLATPGDPHCRLELSGRCVLALGEIQFPRNTGQTTSGSVTLSASIGRDGTVTGIQVAESNVQTNVKGAFVDAAVQNLKTWRVEVAQRADSMRITYSYTLDRLLRPGEVDIQIQLPAKILVKYNPRAAT